MAISFTLVDLKFLVQLSFSLTLQLQGPALAKINKTHESHLVIVLLIVKIPKMKLLSSCTSSR